ncbi:MAG TPA: CRTAC1 family protein [Planctomycetota bacterium]|nr:CRTAC1 family protein [Planctomycetota bacterium]
MASFRLALLLVACSKLAASDEPDRGFLLRDVGVETGIREHLAGIRGHAAAWGDVDGDGWLDLWVGAFAGDDTKPSILLLNREGTFEPARDEILRLLGCASGAVFADLDNDGDVDLYVSNVSKDRGPPGSDATNRLFRNDGEGRFVEVSARAGLSPQGLKGRSVAVLDFDGDGLLDLAVGEDHAYGAKRRSRLFRNKGDLRFEDATEDAGLPDELCGLGVAAGDLDGDGWPDLLFAGRDASNVIFLNDGHGRFREAPGSRDALAWRFTTGDDFACGAALGDLDGDGRLDVVLGQHFKRPWIDPVPVRAWVQRDAAGGTLVLEEITDRAGLVPLPMKAPHIEVEDFDNDGRIDVSTSIIKLAAGKASPVVFEGEGLRDGLPRFRAHALDWNDFPTADDQATRSTGEFFEKMLRDRKIDYAAAGPVADFDRDGRLDILFVSWWKDQPSFLFRNETPSGRWLDVSVRGTKGVNRMGVGAIVRVYRSGRLGVPSGLLGARGISIGRGYASGQAPIAHFGLGDVETVDVEVILPHGKGRIERRGVRANERILLEGP